MKYMGSKSRISKYIIPIIQKYIDENNIKLFVDIMAVGMNIIDKIKCENKIANDINKYLIALFLHLKDNGELPEMVEKDFYNKIRKDYYDKENGIKNDTPNWLIGAVGFFASYNGRFFDGGYAKPGYEKN